uniref:Uncharacterized protein n=1 Tax=Acrobeloides nanus TaxID=290746 RepID=A0A914CQF4_9BILA
MDKKARDLKNDKLLLVSEAFSKEIQEKAPEALRRMPCFFIAAPSLRKIVNKEPAQFTFQESQFIDFMIMQSKYDQNIVRA